MLHQVRHFRKPYLHPDSSMSFSSAPFHTVATTDNHRSGRSAISLHRSSFRLSSIVLIHMPPIGACPHQHSSPVPHVSFHGVCYSPSYHPCLRNRIRAVRCPHQPLFPFSSRSHRRYPTSRGSPFPIIFSVFALTTTTITIVGNIRPAAAIAMACMFVSGVIVCLLLLSFFLRR